MCSTSAPVAANLTGLHVDEIIIIIIIIIICFMRFKCIVVAFVVGIRCISIFIKINSSKRIAGINNVTYSIDSKNNLNWLVFSDYIFCNLYTYIFFINTAAMSYLKISNSKLCS
jgi:hypothetical protein